MPDPSQRWADVTAFVDALERGRRTTAATSGPSATDRGQAQQLYEQAVSLAEDEAFSEAYRRWRGVAEALAAEHAELGRHGFALGAALFNAAREASGSARRRGFRRCVDVLADAIHSFEAADDPDAVHDASSLAADACEQWMSTYPPGSPEHQPLAELARGFREHDR